jgi:predicted metal-dependent enzyme (double-stranded beta helix superfamily)
METVFTTLIDQCKEALESPDPQGSVETVLRKAVEDPALAEAVSTRTEFAKLDDLAIHRDDRLTLLAGAMPPGFRAAPHNHNLWSVVGVCSGREDNQYFERDGDGLRQCGEASVTGPGVLPNAADVIHAIRNPLDTPLVVVHAYGGDLFSTPRSNWDPETHKEIPFDWSRVRSE